MSVKLIAIDLDDTLLNDNLEISARNKEAILKAVEKGIVVTIATGRMFRAAIPFAKQLNLDVPLIVYNGGLVKKTLSEEIVFHKPIPSSSLSKIYKLTQKHNWYIQTYIDDYLYVKEATEYTAFYCKLANVSARVIGNKIFDTRRLPTKIMIQDEESKIKGIIDELNFIFNNKGSGLDEVSITTSKPTYVEITAQGVNKGAALSMLAESLAISCENIMVIGDSKNDVSMLKLANYSVVVENGCAEAKEVAKIMTKSNNDSGVAVAIEKYALGS
ncbi:Cof-type HAD-IIB family hydrolase [Selenomonadales bacterium OttesenSCG-928-I06]|nr:Cof-type HAD-IIB family hydrolase [Selenomonadales bacterium OttesenSCG-928-I06]